MARKFLYFIAVCIVLFIVGSIADDPPREATEIAFVPRGEFVEQNHWQPMPIRTRMWYSRPARKPPIRTLTAGNSGDRARSCHTRSRTRPASCGRTKPISGQSTGKHRLDRGRSRSARAARIRSLFVPPTSAISVPAATGTPRLAIPRPTTARAYSFAGLASPSTRADEIWAPTTLVQRCRRSS